MGSFSPTVRLPAREGRATLPRFSSFSRGNPADLEERPDQRNHGGEEPGLGPYEGPAVSLPDQARLTVGHGHADGHGKDAQGVDPQAEDDGIDRRPRRRHVPEREIPEAPEDQKHQDECEDRASLRLNDEGLGPRELRSRVAAPSNPRRPRLGEGDDRRGPTEQQGGPQVQARDEARVGYDAPVNRVEDRLGGKPEDGPEQREPGRRGLAPGPPPLLVT